MVLIKCSSCKGIGKETDVPAGGQCSVCGLIDGLRRLPSDEEFARAREINRRHNYPLFRNVDMVLLDVASELKQK